MPPTKAKGKWLRLRVTRLVLGGGGRCQESCDEIHRLAGCAAYVAKPPNGDPAPKDWKDAARYIKKRGGVRKLADLYAARCTDDGDWNSYVARQADSTDEWYTPPIIFDLLGCEFDLDPASPGKHITPWIPVREVFIEHGLEREWFGYVWCNSPFGRGVIDQWVRKFCRHHDGIILVPDRTRSLWWQELLEASDLMLAVNRPISFVNDRDQRVGQMPVGTHLAAIGPKGVEALKRASKRGLGKLMKHVDVHDAEA